MDIYFERKWKSMMSQVDEISASDDDEGFQHYLMVAELWKKDIISILKT